jgi:tRNA A37 threonylcarbamoyladenosine dehydratase
VVCGLGAVGSYATEALARAGIGRLRLVDFYRVQENNLNRQLYALRSTIGRPKVDVAAERVRDINPHCTIEPMPLFIDHATLPDVLGGAPDVVIDAIDSLSPKVALLRAAVEGGLPVISSMGAATRTDPMAVRVADISQTNGCPLARLLRKQLRRQGIHTGIRCIYSTEPAAKSAAPPETKDRGRPRSPLGSISFLTGLFGLIAAREAIAFRLDWYNQ